MGIFSKTDRTVKPTYDLPGVIDRIGDLGSEGAFFNLRLVGSRSIYEIFYACDGSGPHSLSMAKPGDHVTLTLHQEDRDKDNAKAVRFVNHDF